MNESKNINIYPENGSVVIIDDKMEEALPLMMVLSKLDIPFKYFSGKVDELPASPLNNVRILFLDIELEGMEGVMQDKTKLSTLAEVIDKVISERCQPYIIIAWTNHKELVDELKKYIQNNKKMPLLSLCIDKADCIVNDNNEYFDLNAITTEVNSKLKNSDIFIYFLLWQNLVNKAASIVINDIASVYDYDENWNGKLLNVLHLLAEAYAGKQVSDDTIKYSMLGFNGLFLDILENLIIKKEKTDENKNLYEIRVNLTDEERIKGELNRRLLISFERNEKPMPGNIYYNIESKEDEKKEFLIGIDDKNISKYSENDNDNVVNKSKLIRLEVSPVCDYAQNKWKKCRILQGIIIPQSFENKIKKADYIYKSPLFLLDNEPVYLVFDIRYLTSVEIKNLENKESLMRIRKELLNDIQTKISAHISRLGITSL